VVRPWVRWCVGGRCVLCVVVLTSRRAVFRLSRPIEIGPPALEPELRVSQEAKSQAAPEAGWEERNLSGPPLSRGLIG
jgi:hypothetical protein